MNLQARASDIARKLNHSNAAQAVSSPRLLRDSRLLTHLRAVARATGPGAVLLPRHRGLFNLVTTRKPPSNSRRQIAKSLECVSALHGQHHEGTDEQGLTQSVQGRTHGHG